MTTFQITQQIELLQVQTTIADLHGVKHLIIRLLILKTKIDENPYVLCNVYAPTQDHKRDQINFLINVKNSLSTYQNENILLGGDFNLHLNPKLDTIDSMSNKSDNIVYREEMLSFLDSMNLSDCFRNLYPNL